jgi:hypothetical protein
LSLVPVTNTTIILQFAKGSLGLVSAEAKLVLNIFPTKSFIRVVIQEGSNDILTVSRIEFVTLIF